VAALCRPHNGRGQTTDGGQITGGKMPPLQNLLKTTKSDLLFFHIKQKVFLFDSIKCSIKVERKNRLSRFSQNLMACNAS